MDHADVELPGQPLPAASTSTCPRPPVHGAPVGRAGSTRAATCGIIKYLLDHGATRVRASSLTCPPSAATTPTTPKPRATWAPAGRRISIRSGTSTLFKDIDLGKVSTSIVTHLPGTAFVHPGMYFAVAGQRQDYRDPAGRNLSNDFIMETCVGSAPRSCRRRRGFSAAMRRRGMDLQERPALESHQLQRVQPARAGTDAVQEVAIATSNAIATAAEEFVVAAASTSTTLRRACRSGTWPTTSSGIREVPRQPQGVAPDHERALRRQIEIVARALPRADRRSDLAGEGCNRQRMA